MNTHLLPVNGFKTAGISAGIKKGTTKKDMMLVFSDTPAVAAAVFTKNLAAAAPVHLSKAHMNSDFHQAVLVNSGNANACTGDSGHADAVQLTRAVAEQLGINPNAVLNASTGIIGIPLPMDVMVDSLPKLVSELSTGSMDDAAEAILTTDTFPKKASVTITLGGKPVTLSGFSKGSGMIHPNMATMLGFVLTDASISKPLLQKALSEATEISFNQVSVDGDTSTNDCVFVLANGTAGNEEICSDTSDYAVFAKALKEVCIQLAMLIAKDGEGATKLVEVNVTGAASDAAARALSKAVVASSLVKAALFGNDANWGRIVCALGYAGVDTDLSKASVSMKSAGGSLTVFKSGRGLVFDEDLALKVLKQPEVNIAIVLEDGTGSGTAWGCDLSYEYVKINGDYRS